MRMKNQIDIRFFNSQCWTNIFKVMKKMQLQGKIFYPAKPSFKYEGIIKTCPQGTASEGMPHKNPQ